MVTNESLKKEKLKAAIAHIVGNCPSHMLGQVKLHKVLYFSDMISYLASGSPLTGATYRKRPFGPTCDALLFALDDLRREGRIAVKEVDYFGYKKREFVSLLSAESNFLSDAEVNILDEMIEFVCKNNSAKTISEFSHAAGWDMVEFGEAIPYCTAIHLVPVEPSQDAIDWAESVGDKIANEGVEPGIKKMEGRDAASFRARLAELHSQRVREI